MSRIGTLPVQLPDGVDVSFKDHVVTVKGKKGELVQDIHPDISVEVEDGQLVVTRPTEQKRHRAMHGLYRSLIHNMVTGVSEGWKRELQLVGVGFRATNKGQLLEMNVGYSHPVVFLIPDEISVSTEMVKGQPPKVTLESVDRQLLNLVASKIRAVRKPEPYKGKGIKYADEILRRKEGKSAAK